MMQRQQTGGVVSGSQLGGGNSFCAKCLEPVKPGAQFCPHCGAEVIETPKRRKRRGRWFAIIVGVAVAIFVANRRSSVEMQQPRVAHATEVASMDAMLTERIDALTADINRFSGARDAAQEAREQLNKSLPEIENFRNRLKTAIERADDEGRWPAKVAGREFSKSEATTALSRINQYLASANRSILDCDRRIAQFDSTITSLQQIREQLRSHQARIDAGFSEQEFPDIQANAMRLSQMAMASHREVSSPIQVKPADLDSLLK
jgi:chromosome segregation ATPase/predicted nucleic acid-binding Zn ribbon protein